MSQTFCDTHTYIPIHIDIYILFLIFAIILGVLGLIFAGLAEFTGLARFPGLARFAGHAHIVRTAIASPGPPARGARIILYHELQELHKMREFCQASRPTGTQRGNKSDPLYIYTQKIKEKLGSRGLRGHMWGLRCGGPLAPRRTLATHTVSTASRPAGDCCIGVKEATVLPGRRGSRGVLLSLEHPGQPTPSRQRHDPKATAALVSRMPGA